MNENQITFLICMFAWIMRVPRLVERWKAPLLRGHEWFFSVEVPSDFLAGPGIGILRSYRARLFLPWAVELPILAALLLTGRARYIILLIAGMGILTRLNYYAALAAAEKQARVFEVAAAAAPVSTISLSLEPRTLRAYTTPWFEAVIILSIAGPLAWLGYRYATVHDWQLIRRPLAQILFYAYMQAGLLLLKCGLVRARYAAPAANADQHLAWRESLRRLSTTICDYSRVLVGATSFAVTILSSLPVKRETQQTISVLFLFGGGAILTYLVWRRRLQHLEVARRTRPAKLLTTPDIDGPVRVICFQPSLPMLLLAGPNGYAVNLASAAAITTGLYLAGYGLLWMCMKLV